MKNSSRRLVIYENKLNEIKKEYIESVQKKEDKLKYLKKFIEKCNIFETYNLEYLRELKKEDNTLFKEELEKYEDAICEENLKKEFGISKISAFDKIIKLISEIAGLFFFNNLELKKELKNLFFKLKEVNNKKFKLNFQILPLDNKELYLNILYEILCVSFYNKIRDFEDIGFNQFEKEIYKNYVKKKKSEISQKIDNCKKKSQF